MKLKSVDQRHPKDFNYLFFCPGCNTHHGVITEGGPPVWTFNGDENKPTLSPSIRVQFGKYEGEDYTKHLCHSFIVNGNIQFLNDCTHNLAGQTVELPEVD